MITIQDNVFSNNSIENTDQSAGSVILLDNPGNISILNSDFKNNFGISGSCISYSETSKLLKPLKFISFFNKGAISFLI